jgi:hypothetical protein
MDAGNVSAIISAVAGISGVVIGNSFVAIKEGLTNRTKRRKDTAYLGVIVVSHLERFANGCMHAACDDGTEQGQPAGRNGEEHVVITALPEFHPLDIDVDWRLLPKHLLYSILRLPDQHEQLMSNLAGIQEYNYDPPEHTGYFWARRRGYAELGLRASDFARSLRLHAGLPSEGGLPDEWSRDKQMSEVIKNVDSEREAHERRRSAINV